MRLWRILWGNMSYPLRLIDSNLNSDEDSALHMLNLPYSYNASNSIQLNKTSLITALVDIHSNLPQKRRRKWIHIPTLSLSLQRTGVPFVFTWDFPSLTAKNRSSIWVHLGFSHSHYHCKEQEFHLCSPGIFPTYAKGKDLKHLISQMWEILFLTLWPCTFLYVYKCPCTFLYVYSMHIFIYKKPSGTC